MSIFRWSIILLCWLVMPACNVYAQKLKTTPFQQVEVPKPLMHQLNALVHEEDKTSTPENPMYITNLLATKDIQYRDGIYYFRVMSPHALGRIFVNYKGQATIFKSFDAYGIMQEYQAFLSKNELPEKTKIAYLKAIANHLDQQYIAQPH